MPNTEIRTLKKYYKLKEIDDMIHNVVSYNKSVPILYPKLEQTFKDSKIYIEQLKLVQNRNILPTLPTEIISYIIELKYNIDAMNDLGVLICYNDMVNSYKDKDKDKGKDKNTDTDMKSEFLYGYFRFMSAEDITILDKSLFYFDIACKYMGMGHILTLSIDKEHNKFFFKYGGGSNYFDYVETFNKSKQLYTLDKYKDNLFSLKEIYAKMEMDRDSTSKSDDEYSPYTSISDCIVDS